MAQLAGQADFSTTRSLAEFVVGLRYEDVPVEVIERVKRQCLDVVGVALAGSTQPVGAVSRRLAERQRSAAESTVWGSDVRASPSDSAFANGVAAHALDFDDMWQPGSHPTAPTFPATLALAESLGASGKDVLVAQLAAYEVMGKLNASISGRAGWHTTGVFGGFGATAAACKLLGLDARRTAMAWGIASSEASGIEGHSGTMTKPFHAGQAARNGIVAACLAADGFTANDRVFDSGRGFFQSFYRGLPYDAWRVTVALGAPFHIMSPGVGIKMYPAGYHMHNTFEAALQLAEQHDILPEHVAEVRVGLRRSSNFDRSAIKSGLEGKFSMQFMAVAALVDRRLTIESFTDEHVLSAPVQQLLQRVQVYVDPSIPDNPDLSYNPVTVRLVDGREYTASVTLPRSHWRYQLEREEWIEKFRANAVRVFGLPRVDQLQDALERLDELADVRELTKHLATA